MVQAYLADPKTGGVMLLMTPREIELTLVMVMRGMNPQDLNSPETLELLRGYEVVNRNFPTQSPRKEE